MPLYVPGLRKPIERANLHGVSVSADTNILGTDITPIYKPTLFRILCSFDTAGVFREVRTKAGVVQVSDFNGGSSLTANSLYIFDILIHEGDSMNLRYSIAATLKVLRVQEIPVATT